MPGVTNVYLANKKVLPILTKIKTQLQAYPALSASILALANNGLTTAQAAALLNLVKTSLQNAITEVVNKYTEESVIEATASDAETKSSLKTVTTTTGPLTNPTPVQAAAVESLVLADGVSTAAQVTTTLNDITTILS